MKIVCFIDNLGAGGAQRQLTTLGVFFRKAGHSVSFITYHEDMFFRPMLDANGVGVERLRARSRLGRPVALRKRLLCEAPDAVLAFLEGPCLYAELAGLPKRPWRLVVSERLEMNGNGKAPNWKRGFHRLADCITTNSHANRRALAQVLGKSAARIATIYNCLDLESFKPAGSARRHGSGPIRLVVAASYQPRKNTLGLIRAVAMALSQHPTLKLQIDWYGGFPLLRQGSEDRRYFEECQELIRGLGLARSFHLHEKDKAIISRYQEADAVALPSLAEGLPNAVCEGMACGLPVLASRIGDADILVDQGVNGFLFEPQHPEDMARALLDFCGLSREARLAMGVESRRKAEVLFSPEHAVNAYQRLLEAAATGREVPVRHWPAEPGLVDSVQCACSGQGCKG